MNRFIKTLSVFLLVATVSFVSAQQKEVDDIKKGGASHETGGPGDKGYNKEKGKGMESKGNFFQRLFGGSKKKEKKENDPNN